MDKAPKGHGDASAEVGGQGSLSESTSQNRLMPLVEAEIIPRLMMAHRNRDADNGTEAKTLPADEVVAFAEAILHKEPAIASEQITKLRSHGLALESVYLYLLAPAARYLGELFSGHLRPVAYTANHV